MDNEKILYSKDSFKFLKNGDTEYSVNYVIENNSIQLDNIIDFPFIKLIYDLNRDIIERIELKMKEDNRALLVVVIKDIFEDLGIPQYYSCMIIERKYKNERIIEFSSEILNKSELMDIENEIDNTDKELIPILKFNSEYLKINNNKIECVNKIEISNNVNSNNISIEIVEKMIGKILYKIFNRIILFIKSIKK